MDLFHIPGQAASVLSGGVNIGERLIGGKTELINLDEKQSLIMSDLKPETVKTRWHRARPVEYLMFMVHPLLFIHKPPCRLSQ